MTSLLALLQNGWTAFSLASLLAGGAGVGLILLALLGTAYLPAFIRRPLIGAGIAILVGAALYQAGQAKGAADAFARDAARAIAAETERAAKAERATRDDRARAVQDLADDQARTQKLQEMNDALRKDPDRDRVCIDRDLSRRLHDL